MFSLRHRIHHGPKFKQLFHIPVGLIEDALALAQPPKEISRHE